MPRRTNHRGRSKGGGRFVQLYYWMLDSPAWLSLTSQAVAVYLTIAKRYNGQNNGNISLSQREAADLCNISKATARRALGELIDKGFIEATQLGAFTYKKLHATEWRLTALFCNKTGKPASKQFMAWRGGTKIQNPGPIRFGSEASPLPVSPGDALGSGQTSAV